MNRIVVCTPCYGGMVSGHHALGLLDLQATSQESVDNRFLIKQAFNLNILHIYTDSLVPRARARLVSMFFDIVGATHLMFIDADIGFKASQIVRMLLFDKDFVAGIYPTKGLKMHPVGELCQGDDLKRDNDFATANYAGGGFQLIKREVFLEMFREYDFLKFRKIDTEDHNISDNFYDLFSPMISSSSSYLSEDFAFCQRWRHMGGEIWVDLLSNLTHSGVHDFQGKVYLVDNEEKSHG